VKIWNLDDPGSAPKQIDWEEEAAAVRRVTAVAFRPQGDYLVVSAQSATDSLLRVFNLASGNEEKRFRNDVGRARSIVFDHTGRHLLLGRENGGAELWEFNWGEQTPPAKKVAELSESAHKFIFDPKDRYLAWAERERVSLGIWRAYDLATDFCSRLGRNLSYGEWQYYSRGLPYARTCDNLPVHQTVINEAIRLVDIDETKALELFTQIKNASPSLGVQPEKEVAWHKAANEHNMKLTVDRNLFPLIARNADNEMNRTRMNTLLSQSFENYKQALKFYEDKSSFRSIFSPVDKRTPELIFPRKLANTLNGICWWGSLFERAEEVYDRDDKGKSACAQAVLADPYNGNHLDTLAVAKALTAKSREDYESAIRNFKQFVAWTDNQAHKARRNCYVEDLEKHHKNPFQDPDMKKKLLKELYADSSDENLARRCGYRDIGPSKP
jgi:hypothetical protein